MSAPDVSIVLICFNDAARLPTAIASLREQTLRSLEIIVVDDASTDATGAVVAEAMAADPRIRYVRLAANSGGCSAPRNRGIEQARGTWVMFCDSDDRYERHAAKNLLRAVEAADADLGCGVAERIDVGTGQGRRWRDDLHDRSVLETIHQRPALIADTISVNKIYRRSFLVEQGLKFPEGLLYEDQLFTMQVYCQARRIAVIPETTYLWSVDRIGDELSITQRRKEERNARDRVAINERIDEYLAERGDDLLRRAKARKFLSHDLYLYLSSILEADDVAAQALIDIWEPYVRTAMLDEAEYLRPALRVAVYHLLLRDLDGIRSAMRCLRWTAVVEVPVVRVGDRQAWACEHLAAGPHVAGREPGWWLDVTALAIAGAPVPERRMCHRLSSLRADGTHVVAMGRTSDAFAMLDRASNVRLAVATGTGRIWCSVPVSLVLDEPGHGSGVAWSVDGRWCWHADPVVEPGARGSLVLVMEVDGQRNQMAVRMPAAEVRPRSLSLGHGVVVRVAPGDFASVAWRVVRPGRGWRAWRQGRGPLAGLHRVVHRRMLALTSLVASRLPPRAAFVFEAGGGRAFDGHPRAISEHLAVQAPDVPQAWSYALEAERVPGWAEAIRRDTLRHRWVSSRARWWVDDTGMAQAIRKHPRNRMLQTWRGQPLAKVGNDRIDAPLLAKAERTPTPGQVRRWDLLLAPSNAFAAQVPAAVGFRGDLIEGATPFGDAVLAQSQCPTLRSRLGLPDDRTLVLATFAAPHLPFDLAAVIAAVGSWTFWLLSTDAGTRLPLPAVCRAASRDISADDNRAAYLAAADVLVTDGSIWTMDVARLGRPVIIWEPGYRTMRQTCGTMVDLPAGLPTASTAEGLITALEASLDRTRDDEAAVAALAALAGPADGRGAQRCVTALRTGRMRDEEHLPSWARRVAQS